MNILDQFRSSREGVSVPGMPEKFIGQRDEILRSLGAFREALDLSDLAEDGVMMSHRDVSRAVNLRFHRAINACMKIGSPYAQRVKDNALAGLREIAAFAELVPQ